MAFDFPTNPPVGTIISGPNGVQYRYDGTKWVATPLPALYAPLNSPVFTGDPQAPTAPVGDADQSLANTQFVARSVAPAFNDVGRSFVHNGLFNVAQRGVGNWTTAWSYTADRWQLYFSGGTCNVNVGPLADVDRAAIRDEQATQCLQCIVAGGSVAGSTTIMLQRIEGARRLSGKTVTLSFWLTTNVAGKIGASIDQIMGTGGSPSGPVSGAWQAVSTTVGWARYSMTFSLPSLTGKILGTNNNDCSVLNLIMSASPDQGGGVVPVQSATFVFWGVQLEIGSVATPLEKIDVQQDLARCQRFYCIGDLSLQGYATTGVVMSVSQPFRVTMRATPTMTAVWSNSNISNPQVGPFSGNSWQFFGTATAAGQCILGGSWTASADL